MEKTPLISIDICSDEDIAKHTSGDDNVVVNYPGSKRHSTGDASSDVAAFNSSLLGSSSGGTNGPNGGINHPRSSTVSLYDPGSATGRANGSRRGSRTAITDF